MAGGVREKKSNFPLTIQGATLDGEFVYDEEEGEEDDDYGEE